MGAQLGRNRRNFRVWQDREAIAPGKQWETAIKAAVEQSAFFIPIVTPRALNSDYCHTEFEAFLERERAFGRSDLVFPILYITVPALDDEAHWRNNSVLSVIGKRQYVDWRPYRHLDVNSPIVREAIEHFCQKIVETLRQSWLSPEERKRQEEAAAKAQAEEQSRREEAEATRRTEEEARRRSTVAAEEKRIAERRERQDAEAKRAEEDARSEQVRIEARLRAEEERKTREAAAKQRADEESAFAKAKRADAVSAVDQFLTAYPNNNFAAEAKALRAALIERDEAYSGLTSGVDPAVLKGFLDRYPEGRPAAEVRRRLSQLEPGHTRLASRRVLIVGGLATAGALGVASFFTTRNATAPPQSEPVVNRPPSPASRLLHVLSGQTVSVESAHFSHDGSRILTQPDNYQPDNLLHKDTAARLWDTSTGAAVAMISLDADGSPVAVFSPDGNRVLTWKYFTDSGALRLWDGRIGSAIATLSGHTRDLNRVRFSMDSSRIVTASSDQTARLWDGSAGELLATLTGHSAPVKLADFNSEATVIVTTSQDGTVRLWNAKTGAPRAILKIFDAASVNNDWPFALFNPDGRPCSHAFQQARSIVARCERRACRNAEPHGRLLNFEIQSRW